MKSVRVTLETVIGRRVGNLACDTFLIPNAFSFGQVEGETNYVACYLNLVTENDVWQNRSCQTLPF